MITIRTLPSNGKQNIRMIASEEAAMINCSAIFDSFGILEHILSYSDVETVLAATAVSRRWKQAGRSDDIWRSFVTSLYKGKKGTHSVVDAVFWRTLLSNDAVSRMSEEQIHAIFRHPLLSEKEMMLRECSGLHELRQFLQVHMLDVMSDDEDSNRRHRFFSDIYFGSYLYASMDSRRDRITQAELCIKYGFEMFFKILADDVDEEDQEHLITHSNGILLYPYSTVYFDESRDFRMDLAQAPHSHHPTNLKWTWVGAGRAVQVGPYPPLIASRRDDWGWKLENMHVVLIFKDDS